MLLLLLALQCPVACQGDSLVIITADSLQTLELAATNLPTVTLTDTVHVLDSVALELAIVTATRQANDSAIAVYNLQLAGLIQGMHGHDTFLDGVAKWAPAVVAVVVGVILVTKCCKRGGDGRDGDDGMDGQDGMKGQDGTDGEDGKNGKDKHHHHKHPKHRSDA